MTITILIIDKTGKVKETPIKTYNECELYKKAGFKSSDGFKCRHTWDIPKLNGKSYSISMYGKVDGRANQENKYEFPPPLDVILFFNSCVIINKVNDEPTSITSIEWKAIYNNLYGGFDELCDDDDDEDDEDDDDDEDDEDDDDDDDEDDIKFGEKLTKTGYIKDDFIVDDDEVDSDEDYKEPIVKKRVRKCIKKIPKQITTSKKSPRKISKPENNHESDELSFINCTDELIEESYI